VLGSATWADVAAAAGDASAVHARHQARALESASVLAGMPTAALANIAENVTACLSSGADDAVKTAVLGLAGRAGASGALPAIEQIILDRGDRDLQVAALHAAARLWAAAGQASGNADLRAALDESLASDDPELALAAAAALGQFGSDAPVVFASR
jgi:hypothetical protein